MSGKLGLEARMTIQELKRRGWSQSAIARTLRVSEGAVRYHLRRQAAGATDGRSRQQSLAARHHEAIEAWLDGEGSRINLALLHEHLVEERGYTGSLRSVQRYCRRHFPPPPQRARRRVETPPGSQAQVDWAEFRGVLVAGRKRDLYAFQMQLSHSRYDAVVWSERKNQLAWCHVHNEAFRRLEGIPATVRVDNEKTAICRGAGAWGEINRTYRRYAETVRFHIDACPPRAPQAKGKIERRIRDHRLHGDPKRRHWSSYEELQSWTDERVARSAERRVCPPTGTSVRAAWEAEKSYLGPVPILPEPFDIVVTRTVAPDCTVVFEGRTYSVPFVLVGLRVEVRGCSEVVQVLHGARIVASHPRHTESRIVLDPQHFEGEATETILPPVPLGRMGRRLAQIAAMLPEQRPLDLYAELAEVAR